MLTQPQQPLMTSADPLTMQFMTGGQMGYMPQAQYLTPADYGAFRTLPVPQQHAFLGQDPGFFQSMLIRNYGSMFGLPKYTWNTYNPAVNQQLYMSNITRQSYDQMAGGAAAALDAALPMAAMGMLGGIPGAALGMMMPSLVDPFVNRIRDMRTIQNMTMSKIVGGRDMNAATGMGFNAAAGRSIDSFLRTQAAGDVLFKEGDYRKLMQLGVENGMFDYASNAQQYKDIVKKLRNSMTTMMEVVGSTDFKDLMKEFKRMQTMGADISQFQSIARKENMFARITGLSHSDMVNTYGQQGALIFSQAGLNNYQGSLAAMSNAATITLGQRMGLLTPEQVARHGGVSGMAQTMTQEDAQAQNRAKDILLPYLMNGQLNGLRSNANLSDLLRDPDALRTLMSSGHKIRGPEQMMAYQRNRDNVWGQAIDKFGQENLMGALAFITGREVNLTGRSAAEYGFRMQGISPEMARIKAEHLFSRERAEQVEREAALERKKRREEEDLARNPFRKFARDVDSALTRISEATFGKLSGAYGEWAAAREREAAGVVDLSAALQGPITSEELRMARGSGGQGGSYSGPGITAGGVDSGNLDDWFKINRHMTLNETSVEGRAAMGKVSMAIDSSGRWINRKSAFADRGGSSFGAMQFTTEKLLRFLNRSGAQSEKERNFLKYNYGIDVSDKATQQLLLSTQRKIGAMGKGKNPNFTSEEARVLHALQQGWGGMLSDSEISEQMTVDYINYGEKDTYGVFSRGAEKDSKIAQTMQHSAFQAFYRSLSNNMGGGDKAGKNGSRVGALGRVRAALRGMSEQEVADMMASPEGRQALLTRIVDGVLKEHAKSNAHRPDVVRQIKARWTKELKQLLPDVAGESLSPQEPELTAQQENFRKAENQHLMGLTRDFRGDEALRASYRGDGPLVLSRDKAQIQKVLVAQSGTDAQSAKILSSLLSKDGKRVSIGANELSAMTEGLFSTEDFTSHSSLTDKTREFLEKRFNVKLSGADIDIAAAHLAGEQLRRGDMKDTVTKLHSLNAEHSKQVNVATQSYMQKVRTESEGLLNEALGKDSAEEKDLVRSKTSLNQVYWLGEMSRSLSTLEEKKSPLAESYRRQLQSIAKKLGLSDAALEKIIKGGELDVKDIKNTAGQKLGQDEVDKMLRLAKSNASNSRYDSDYEKRFELYQKMDGAGMYFDDATISKYATNMAYLNKFARDYGYADAKEMLGDTSQLERRVINSGTATRGDIALAERILADKKKGVDLVANAHSYVHPDFTPGGTKADDSGSVRASQAPNLLTLLNQDTGAAAAGTSAAPNNGALADSTINRLAGTIDKLNGVLQSLDTKLSPGR